MRNCSQKKRNTCPLLQHAFARGNERAFAASLTGMQTDTSKTGRPTHSPSDPPRSHFVRFSAPRLAVHRGGWALVGTLLYVDVHQPALLCIVPCLL